jgi:hypothetical protein
VCVIVEHLMCRIQCAEYKSWQKAAYVCWPGNSVYVINVNIH